MNIIKSYQQKILNCDKSLQKIGEMIRESRKDSSIDTDDLRGERSNVNRDRQLYVQFLKDLEDYELITIK